MALSPEQYFRQAKRAMIYDRSTKKGLIYLRAISESKLDDKIEYDPLKVGGELKDTAVKERTMSLNFTAYNYEKGAIAQFTNGSLTDYNSTSTGEIINPANVKGTTVYSSAGISSIAVTTGGESDLKEGIYVLEATSAAVCALYAMTDLFLKDGTDKAYLDDTYMVLDDIAVDTSTTTALSGFGLTITGGAHATAMTIGDTMTFEVRAADRTGYQIIIGDDIDFDDVGIVLYPAPHNNNYSFIDIYRVKIAGMPFELKDSWSSYQITADVLKDEAKAGYYRIVRNQPE